MTTLVCLAIIVFMPATLSIGSIPFRIKQFSKPDINKPREQGAMLSGMGARIVHAQSNAWEAAIMFTGTVFISTHAGVDLAALATASTIFVAIRCVYVVVYLLDFGWLRFLTFLAGLVLQLNMVFSALG